MTDKPTTAAGYGVAQTELVRATCLYVATKLGDVMDQLVVVGGLVPSLLVKQEDLSIGVDSHVGTMDLDMGLTVALLEEGRTTKSRPMSWASSGSFSTAASIDDIDQLMFRVHLHRRVFHLPEMPSQTLPAPGFAKLHLQSEICLNIFWF